MHVPATLRNTLGPRALSHRPIPRVFVTPEELRCLILPVERDAAEAECDGGRTAVNHLFWRAGALREAVQ